MGALLGASLALLLPLAARAANDWTIPCHNGQCSYEAVNGTLTSAVLISGSNSSISDLTAAGGWTILDCDTNATAQDLRTVCTGTDNDCSHLYQNGAVGTIVRLPEDCGGMPFARVASEWTHDNQTVPANVAKKLRRRESASAVRGITLDTQFHQVDPNHHGPVAVMVQGVTGNDTLPVTSRRRIEGRGFFSHIVDDIKQGVDDVLQAMSFNVDKSNTKTVDIDKSFPIFDQSAQCGKTPGPTFKAELKVDVDAQAHATINYGVVANGTIVPPKLDDFGLFANFDATLGGTLNVDATGSVSVSSGKIPLFEVGLPGLDFPGILSLGPTFQLNGLATASITADAAMSVDIAYNITGGKLFFPPNKGMSSGMFSPADTHLALSSDPSVSATGTLSAHLIPTVAFGINALEGLAKAQVNLDLDASASMDLTLAESKSNGFSGCADVKTGFDVQAGATGSLLDIFNDSESVTLFSKDFELFKKCFGNTSRREHARSLLSASLQRARRALPAGVTCGTTSVSDNKTSIVSMTIPKAAIVATESNS